MTNIDAGEWVLDRFTSEDWRKYDDELEKGKITLQECLQRQFRLVRASASRIVNEVEPLVTFRDGLGDLVDYCNSKEIPFVVVSGGLDFIIRRLLSEKKLINEVGIFAPKARATKQGIVMRFPRLFEGSSNFKRDLVGWYRAKGWQTYFIGDGLSDFEAIENADVRFVIKGSVLAGLCKRAGVEVREISDFVAVRSALARHGDRHHPEASGLRTAPILGNGG